ncbi:phosphate ABC transporter permease subunit PstC [Lawsonibacter sp.]|uniref:phosphate ABC transporter permease subunit PstC n=1 Tax=Lawsonibacter sp. TaxID=2185275 RepID=UPI002585A031|nr:phosphate ABC transporter permease subunit PstC [Lawsonibacter sp.]MBS1383153.1 phosphate ABC transporter permease subunit PstC [Flavonifractor sp.]MCI6398716.1 phosphate ABC transporter permease subunit PstC [Lawsonibacter sp.]MDU2194793.1 phosphate ABC transporter permease subunit PstC [Clostridiales bacterium]MDY2976383.1 phosphate ABC transporter permease subunit PstC [Oscillospiraceae bacterium]
MKTKGARNALEVAMNIVFLICGLIAVAFVLFISVYLVLTGLPAIREIGLVEFLFGREWASTAAEPKFGILPFILTSVYGTAGAILIGVPIGLFCAIFLAKVAPPRLTAVVRPAVDLLAGIPSVVYGLVGMIVLVPAVREWFHLPDGASLFAAILVLAVMILPSIISVSETALKAVPPEYEEASLGLGATWIETVFRVSVPAASSGIAASVVLGIGRAIGEAMAILMVAGNVANMPSLFNSVKFLTTAVASEMSYSAGLQRQALFSIALVLFLFIMLINVILNTLLKGKKG